MSDKKPPSWLHTAHDRHYVTVAPHDGAVPGAVTYTLPVPLPTGETLVLQGGEAFLRQMRQWAGEQGEVGACRRACCLASPPLPGFERLVA